MTRLQRFAAVIRKEAIQTLRDWPTLVMILLIPVMELFFFAYIGNMTMDHLPTAVADLSFDGASRGFVQALEVSGFFDVTRALDSEAAVLRAIDEGEVSVGVVIPPNFAADIERGRAQALVIIDGSDTFVLQSAYSAAAAIAQVHGMELMVQKMHRMGVTDVGDLPITTSTRILYNPNVDDLIFLIPGLAAMLLQVLTINATVMAVVRERELGTIEQLLITPVRPVELIVGKMLPAVLLTVTDLVVIISLGIYYFKVPFRGSIGLFALLALIFLVSGLGLGLLLSTVANSQRQAQQATAAIMMLSMLLTGMVYPRSTMPPAIQAVGNLIPATFFIRIARGIITKGVGLAFIWTDALILGIYSTVMIVVAAVTFRSRLG
jgi:ABC-2 type transport system permease protein